MVATPLPMLPSWTRPSGSDDERRLERDRRRREQGKPTYFETEAAIEAWPVAQDPADAPTASASGASRARRRSARRSREPESRGQLGAWPRAFGRDLRRRDRAVSRIVGLVREIAQAAVFGISGPVNAFEIAFLIPNTVRVARRRLGSLGGVRPGLQRPAREGRAKARLAGRVVALLADAARPRRRDRAVHRDRAVGDGDLRLRPGRQVRRRSPPASRASSSRSCSCSG